MCVSLVFKIIIKIVINVFHFEIFELTFVVVCIVGLTLVQLLFFHAFTTVSGVVVMNSPTKR